MRKTVTVSIPEEIEREIDSIISRDGVSRSDIVREALKDYLFIRKFRSIRRRMLEKSGRTGIHTDQDVFDRVS